MIRSASRTDTLDLSDGGFLAASLLSRLFGAPYSTRAVHVDRLPYRALPYWPWSAHVYSHRYKIVLSVSQEVMLRRRIIL